MRPKKELGEELDWLTDKISSRVWTLNLGTLATTWSLLVATASGEKLIGSGNAIPVMLLCILAMLCDLGQYLAGYRYAKSILVRLEDSGQTEFEYNKSAPLYKSRDWLFCGKIAVSVVAAIWLVVVLASKFI
jgi:hypothetical protein